MYAYMHNAAATASARFCPSACSDLKFKASCLPEFTSPKLVENSDTQLNLKSCKLVYRIIIIIPTVRSYLSSEDGAALHQ